MNDIRKNAESLSKEVNKTWKKIQEQGKEAAEDTRKLIQKHPGKAVGLAVLVGAVIGVLASFRRKKT